VTVIERLDRLKHDRGAFSCGQESLDRFLKENAQQALAKNISVAFVAVNVEDPSRVLGFYSLSSLTIEAGEIPELERRHLRLPDHRLPATLVGRLAVDQRSQGRGMGANLVADALARSYLASRSIASAAVVVDALDARAAGFYAGYGFRPCDERSRRLYVMMAMVARIFDAKR
jgi:GNAT superfamily N-acetyltransferase